ncbi:unnamed protein product [Didymodactylos carnosus]|uniref:Uncharacterized protein n=1 Tax=Didymodactylos carnosus TaxID=1234261 RepID=A0A816D0B8_9BILA|nr:unnamed protein product [Didymodactylos carnosus]CAF1630051.1 unnamed protein product [Didymodactylos carnosus]CAF3815177.1 unnamed protein product [Didymodactylos carnosus]CAF4528152.1 unnamed protein product [Didymodactylos carnosus]
MLNVESGTHIVALLTELGYFDARSLIASTYNDRNLTSMLKKMYLLFKDKSAAVLYVKQTDGAFVIKPGIVGMIASLIIDLRNLQPA